MGRFDRKPVVGNNVWCGADLGGKAGLTRRLDEQELAAFDTLVEVTRDVPTIAIRRDHFISALLDNLAHACNEDLVDGRGAVILTGLDPERYGQDGFRAIYWYLGQLLGTPAPQSERGDLLGYVRQERDNPFGRGYISNMELNFHNDFHEFLSLACVEAASSGGESGLASSLAIHNIMLDECPDLLEVLYEGWFDGLEAFYKIFRPSGELATDFVPFFSEAGGTLSFHGLNAMFSDRAAAERGVVIPAPLQEALAAMAGIARRPGVAARFMLEPGDMIFWHNWTLLHARSRFENTPGHERVLMRLWLYPHAGRLSPRSVTDRARAVDRIHRQIGAELAVQE